VEKFVGKINSLEPDVLILVDCTDLQMKPGSWELISLEKTIDFTMNTHTISIKRISEFFKMNKFLMGIQPENVKFGETYSEIVKLSADEIVQFINNF